MRVGPGGLLRDCEREVWATWGNVERKFSSSSSLGFWELLLQQRQVRYKRSGGSDARDAQHTARAAAVARQPEALTDFETSRGSSTQTL